MRLLVILVGSLLLSAVVFAVLRLGNRAGGGVVASDEAGSAEGPDAGPVGRRPAGREPLAHGGLGPPPAPSTPAAALAAIEALGARLGSDLDLVTPDPDPATLRELRRLVEAGGLEAATLLDAAARHGVGDPRATALVLACAWAPPGEDTDARLVDIGAARDRAGASAEQHALAAVWALALGARPAGLEELGLRLFRDARGEDGELDFGGLSSVRAWFTLAAIDTASSEWDELFRAELQAGGSGPDRPTRHLWALASRTDPERWGAAALLAVQAGDDRARSGVEMLTDERWLPELTALARDASDPWLVGSALRALAAIPTEAARARVVEALGRGTVTREQALEALRAWSPGRGGPAGWDSATALSGVLDADLDALSALAAGVERAATRRDAARLDAAERAALHAAVTVVRDALPEGVPARRALDRWLTARGAR